VTAALGEGADEIDMVLPWRALQAAARGGIVRPGGAGVQPLYGLNAGSAEAACRAAVAAARSACGAVPLKVIIESGELADADLIAQASRIAIEEGADFIKTSTGKARVHATPEAVSTMLQVIAATGGRCGLKVAGGVQTVADAGRYLSLVRPVFCDEGLGAERLRFGASGLWPALIAALGTAGTAGTGAGHGASGSPDATPAY
jgi:deoxyribose-phosphate aldolase